MFTIFKFQGQHLDFKYSDLTSLNYQIISTQIPLNNIILDYIQRDLSLQLPLLRYSIWNYNNCNSCTITIQHNTHALLNKHTYKIMIHI